MKINGLGTSLFDAQALSPKHETLSLPRQNHALGDSFSITDVAQKLNAKLKSSSSIEKAELTDSLPPIGKKIDSFLKKAENILGRIKDLTELAHDKTLGADSRIEIQIEIEDLRDNLQILPNNLMNDETRSSYRSLFEESGSIGSGTSILERIRTRINNGEKWNVRETWSPETHVLVGDDANNPDDYEVRAAGWYAVDDGPVMQYEDGGVVESTKKIPTVAERLKAETPYDVMDSDSAEESTKLIESQLERIEEFREGLPELIERLQDKESIKAEANLFLESIVFHNGNRELALNAPDSPEYYKVGNEIYDHTYTWQASADALIFIDQDGTRLPIPGSRDLELMSDEKEQL